MSSTVAIVMAAGKGTRMKSDLPKVLVPVAGRPMIEYVLDALNQSGVRRIVVVVGYRADLVRERLAQWQTASTLTSPRRVPRDPALSQGRGRRPRCSSSNNRRNWAPGMRSWFAGQR